MATIHPLSVVDPKARIADDVEIGPFCVIGPEVTLGAGCRLIAHVTIVGKATIGARNTFFPNCVVGTIPQDLKYKGEPSELIIGDNNSIRESATIHTGTEKGGWVTKIGNKNLLMVNAHVGHDARVGDGCILANNVMLAGHVVLGNNVTLSGGAASHHYVRIGRISFVAGYSRVSKDVPPFVRVQDDVVRDTNTVGLKRGGIAETDIAAIDEAVRRLFISKKSSFNETLAEYDLQNGINAYVKELVEFLRERDKGKHGRFLESLRQK